MKKALALLIILPVLMICVKPVLAQCSVEGTFHSPGIYQNDQYCFTRDSPSEVFWQFVNDSYYVFGADSVFGGDTVFVDSVQIKYIANLPCGMYWNTNKTNDTALYEDIFLPGEQGCLTIFGTPQDSGSVYYLDVIVYAYLDGSPSPISQGLFYLHPLCMMLVSDGQACPVVDFNLPGDTASCTVDSSTPFSLGLMTGINAVQYPVENINNYPNPFNETTRIEFSSEDSRQVMFRVCDVLGRIMHEEQVNAYPGRNVITFDRRGISAGVYFYYLGNSQSGATHKMIILD